MGRTNDSDGRIGRRTALKALGAGTALGVGLFSTAGLASKPDGKEVDPSETVAPNPDLVVRRVDKSVRAVSHRYPLLTLSRDTVGRYIDESGLSSSKRADAHTALDELRARYPIEEVQDGNTIWLTLADTPDGVSTGGHSHAGHSHSHAGGLQLPDADKRRFNQAGKAFADGTSGGDVGGEWFHGSHRKMTSHACNEMGIDPNGIADHADDPDKPQTDLGVPGWVPHSGKINAGIQEAFDAIMHHYGQYYDADAFYNYDCSHDGSHSGDFGGLGGAPAAALWHANEAESTTGSTHEMRVGHLTHYPEDMGVPLHTGMGWEQANFDLYYDVWSLSVKYSFNPMYWLHSEYERFLFENWDTGENFSYQFGSDQCSSGNYCYYGINDVVQAIQDEAAETGQYSYEVYDRILDEGDVDWESWSNSNKNYMRDVTENCVHVAGLYTRGFIHDFL